MKKTGIMLMLLITTCIVSAQNRTDYNRQGDEAMKRLDYSVAKIMYEEGVANCDLYSIDQLTSIWFADEKMRVSMRSVMSRCLNCLNDLATRNKDSASIKKLVVYYTEGIGTAKDEAKADFWNSQFELVNDNHQTRIDDDDKPVREKAKIDFFIGYSASLLAPYGLTVGGVGGKVGLYVRFRTNLSFMDYTESCDLDGNVVGLTSHAYRYLNVNETNLMVATGGLIVKASPSFHISLGGGYCKHEVIYKYERIGLTVANPEGTFWAKSEDKSKSFEGVALDLDATLRMGKYFYGSLGCSALNFKYLSANAGIGVFF
ncbi:MAG: hypothetical protein LBT42_07115 [Tannerella sp.]|jgi:hypothetical protein|nr:hypothetical protein [Tannerella sp.]